MKKTPQKAGAKQERDTFWVGLGEHNGRGSTVLTDRGLIHAHMLGLHWGPTLGCTHILLSVHLMGFKRIREAFQA